MVPGDDVADLIVRALEDDGERLHDRDVLVVCSKIIAKAENRIVRLADVKPRVVATEFAKKWKKDARLIEVVLREARRIVRMDRGVVIVETHHGFICANAGVDQSNVDGGDSVCLLPSDPDASARRVRQAIGQRSEQQVAVVISDSFGRPWRLGQSDVAIGVAGLEPLDDSRGKSDRHGFELSATENAVADAVAAAASMCFGKDSGVAACIVRNCCYVVSDDGRATDLIRDSDEDLFR